MDIQLEKLELIKELLETQDASVLKSVRQIFQKKKTDWWDDLSENQKNLLNESMEEYEKGTYSSFDDYIKNHL